MDQFMGNSDADLASWRDEVWRVAYRLLGDSHDASDCLQQTFAEVLRADPEGIVNWRGFLVKVATRRAIDVLRKRYQRKTQYLQPEDEPSVHFPPSVELEFAELREQVRMSLASLPPQQAEAFWLRHIEEWSPEEIASELKLKSGNVRVLVHRAIMHLRNTLPKSYCDTLTQQSEV